MIKSGLPVKVFFALKDQINISTEELAHVVGIAPRTLLRRKQEGRLITRLKAGLPPDWRDAPVSTMTIGDEWLRSKASPVLRVPSVSIPEESNFLLDPAHAERRF